MGDCFGYAVAKAADAPILFIGDDFSRTDLTAAT
jgi:ribonuclease VapC